jgi:hypothetical protein
MPFSLDIENSVFGVTILNQDVFLANTGAGTTNDGVYYSKIFQKPAAHSWYQVNWLDNEDKFILNIQRNTLNKFIVEFRVRVGNNLPWNYEAGKRYTLDEANTFVAANTPEDTDALLCRMTVGRSITSEFDSADVTNPNTMVFNAGSALSYTRLYGDNDGAWSYWCLPILNSPSYMPYDKDFNFLQLRIALKNLDPLVDPNTGLQHFAEVYKTTVSSILRKS